MKGFIVVVALSVVLAASPVFAQAPAGAQAPAKPAPAAPAPAAPAPAPTQAPAQPPAPKPFPQGAKVAYVVLQRIANESADGRVATTRIQALQQKKAAELNEKQQAAHDHAAEAREGRLRDERFRRRRAAEEHREG